VKQKGAVCQARSRLFPSVKTRLSLFLGLLMFTFGFLKFVNPTIGRWFHMQIQQSHLANPANLVGKIAEITAGFFSCFAVPALASVPPEALPWY
jgi:hypothetical protein